MKAGGEAGDRDEMDGIIDSMDMSLSKLPKVLKDRKPGMLQFMELQRVRHDLATELNCTEYKIYLSYIYVYIYNI